MAESTVVIKKYIDPTICTVLGKCMEHQRHLWQTHKAQVAKHTFIFGKTRIFNWVNGYWDSVLNEDIQIRTHNNLLNRDTVFQLSRACDQALMLLQTWVRYMGCNWGCGWARLSTD